MGTVVRLDDLLPNVVSAVGGTWRRDRDGSYWEVSDGEFTMQAEPSIREHGSHRRIALDCSVAHSSFGRLVKHITGSAAAEFFALRWYQHGVDIPTDSGVQSPLKRLMYEALDLATSKPIEALIDEFETNRPDGPSVPQLCHLAALAWRANVSKLLDYEDIFGKGKRLNFVPMITASMVERALDEALKRAQ